MNQKVSVTGLQNIGKLMERNAATTPKPVYAADPKHIIANKTIGNLKHFGGNGTARQAMDVDLHNRGVIEAAIREAYNAGHGDAFAQSQVVDAMLDKQYKARTNLTMPAVVAAVMEQTGMHRMALALDDVATVFDRCKIDYTVGGADLLGGAVVHYTLEILPTASDRAVEGP